MMSPRGQANAVAGSEANTWEDDRRLPADPLVLDPYSPADHTRAAEWNESDPLALDPYSPVRSSALF
jgi:hypothetical protein